MDKTEHNLMLLVEQKYREFAYEIFRKKEPMHEINNYFDELQKRLNLLEERIEGERSKQRRNCGGNGVKFLLPKRHSARISVRQ
jgi:hypothetical protein